MKKTRERKKHHEEKTVYIQPKIVCNIRQRTSSHSYLLADIQISEIDFVLLFIIRKHSDNNVLRERDRETNLQLQKLAMN